MIVVADTSPINYLVQIGEPDLLHRLYREVIVPAAVVRELRAAKTPEVVRAWIEQAPFWVRIADPVELLEGLSFLDAGEHQAISLAIRLQADLLLIDEQTGRREARRLNLGVTGTLGVLKASAEAGYLNLANALERLSRTNFFISEQLKRAILRTPD